MKAKKLPSGNWRVQVDAGKDPSGKRIRKSFTAETKKEAEYLAAEYLRDLQDGASDASDLTVRAAIDNYITHRDKTLSPSTIRGYRQLQRNYYAPIENYMISRITSETVQVFINTLAVDHSPKTVRNVYGLLRSAVRAVKPNKAINCTLPQKRPPQRTIPNDSDVKKLLDNCDGYLRIAILLASIGTLRRGEVCAVMYEDINGNTIHVHADMVQNDNKEWIYKPIPKTSSSDRNVTFPPQVIAEIGEGTGFIIPYNPNTVTQAFGRLKNRVGINTRFHDLRHYAASIMHAIGVPDQYIMERGGWSSDAILKSVYRNVLDDKQKEFTDKTNNYFGENFFTGSV